MVQTGSSFQLRLVDGRCARFEHKDIACDNACNTKREISRDTEEIHPSTHPYMNEEEVADLRLLTVTWEDGCGLVAACRKERLAASP